MPIRHYFTAVTVAAIALAILIWVTLGKSPAVVARDPAREVAHKASAQARAGEVSSHPAADNTQAPPALSGASPTPTIAAEFARSTNLRRFVEQARRQPERGGIYYAEAAINECRFRLEDRAFAQAKEQLARESNPLAQSRRLAAVEFLSQRCAELTEADISGDALSSLSRVPDVRRDQLRLARTSWLTSLTAGDDKSRSTALRRIFELKDPLLLESINFGVWDTVYVDGVAYGGKDRELLSMAWYLVPCRFGLDCGSSSLAVQRTCVVDGRCEADKFALIRQRLSSSPGQYQRVLQLVDQMSELVATGNVDALQWVPRSRD